MYQLYHAICYNVGYLDQYDSLAYNHLHWIRSTVVTKVIASQSQV